MSTRLFVGGLAWGADDNDLRAAFEPHGAVQDATVIRDRETGRSRGFGFVTYDNAEDARKAVAALDGTDLGGRPIRVNEAQERGAAGPRGPRPPRPPGSGAPVVVDRRGGPPRPGGYGGGRPAGGGYGGARPGGAPGGFRGPPPSPGAAGEEDPFGGKDGGRPRKRFVDRKPVDNRKFDKKKKKTGRDDDPFKKDDKRGGASKRRGGRATDFEEFENDDW